MEAWILTVGNEIINGVITDTNRETIARELRSVGIATRGMSSVGDDLFHIGDALRHAMDNARITIVSGGLGPTEDDKTAEAAAKFLGVPLETDAHQLACIEERFRNWGRPMSPSNAKQALFPRGSEPMPNNHGTAPGFLIERDGRIAMFFPGIPRELVRMLREQGIPRIRELLGISSLVFRTRTLYVYGLSESKLGELLADVSHDEEGFHLAFLPRFPIIRLRMDGAGTNTAAVDERLDAKQQAIEAIIKENILSDDGRTMEKVVLDLMQACGWTLALAESITGGMIGEMITRVPGSSKTFMGSIVCYSNDMKSRLLGVADETLRNHGAVSHECAREMALGACKAGSADLAVSVTGIAGPGGGTSEKPVGTFFLGLATPDTVLTRGFLLPGERGWVKTLAAMQALDLLRRHLLDYRIHGTQP